MDILPNFGSKRFTTKTGAIRFLRKFGFRKTEKIDGCDVWETKGPKTIATMYLNDEKLYIVKQVTRINPLRHKKSSKQNSCIVYNFRPPL